MLARFSKKGLPRLTEHDDVIGDPMVKGMIPNDKLRVIPKGVIPNDYPGVIPNGVIIPEPSLS